MQCFETVFRGIICSSDENLQVGEPREEKTVGNHADGGAVDDDIIEILAEVLHQVSHSVGHHQFVGVRRYGAGGKYEQIRILVRLADEFFNIVALSGKIGGYVNLRIYFYYSKWDKI